ERRHALLRVHLVVGLAVLLAAVADEMHRHRAVGDAFPRERDAHAPRGGTAPVGEELHRDATECSSRPTPSTPPRTRSPGSRRPTPDGVPVKTRSPAFSSNQVASSARISGTPQIM